MTKRLSGLPLVLLLAIGCGKPVDSQENILEFTASFDPESKTILQEGNKVNWLPHEDISIFYGASESAKFTSTNTEIATSAVFRGVIGAFIGSNEDGDALWFWSVYPYSEDNTCDGEWVTANLVSTQTGKAETFETNTLVTVARSTGLNLSFKNVCSGVKFSLSRGDIRQVRFQGNHGETVAGTVRITMDDSGNPSVWQAVSGADEIVMNAPEGGFFAKDTWYYLLLLPQTFSEGFTITMVTDAGNGTYVRNDANYVYNRAVWRRFTHINESATFRLKVMSVELDKTTLVLKQNEFFTFTPTILPEDAADKTLTWQSSDPQTISVSDAGTVKALKEGSAVITATSAEGDVSASCTVICDNTSTGSSEGFSTETWD